MDGWIGVDFDGTLAVYNGWNGGKLGEPVKAMVDRVKRWLSEGKKVKVFTARVGIGGGYSLESGKTDTGEFAEEQRKAIQEWCKEHIGQALEVTATKDFLMYQMWDDRAVTVEVNTGRILSSMDFEK